MATTFLQPAPPVVLGTSSAVIYTMPTSPTTTIMRNGRIRCTNTSGATREVTLYADVAATASAAGNSFATSVPIPAKSYLDIDVPVLKAGDTVRGLADAATSVTVHWLDGFLYA